MPGEDVQRFEVLIAGRDANFLRLAAAVLTRAGHAVQTTTDRLGRVERLVRQHPPDVLVLEVGQEPSLQTLARVRELGLPLAVVLVADDADVDPHDGTPVVSKWGPPTELIGGVEHARARVGANAPAKPRPRLRLVDG